LAEAFAEKMHAMVRREYWGYAPDEAMDDTAIIREQYRGIRPAPGYPACPDHSQKPLLFSLLGAEQAAGISLTESHAMMPTAAVSGWYFGHPEASYFGIGRVELDQLEDYAARSEVSLDVARRRLSPVLSEEALEASKQAAA
jgi:5-methyltetrahydrofolate--homocysteine methyltransferase